MKTPNEPWTVNRAIITSGKEPIAIICSNIANAHLISAAPELLHALQGARHYLETPGDWTKDEVKWLMDDIDIAISKVGEST